MVTVRTEDIDYKQRCYVQALRFSAGWTYDRIAKDQNLPLSTVAKICKGPATPQRKNRCGRKIKIDTPTRRLLVFTATKDAEHRQKPYEEIAKIVGVEASNKTLREAFAKEGYHRRSARKKPFLNYEKKSKRLNFALAHRHWTVADWRRVIWTDESYIWLGGKRGKVYITRAAEEVWLEDCLVPKFSKQDSIMIWGGILGLGGKKAMVIWEREDWGTITAKTYVDHVLVPVIWPMWYWESVQNRCNLWLMEDGASAHRAKLTRAYREYFRIPCLQWPPSSPDLNPIENIWNILKNRLNARNPRPKGKEEVKRALLEEWEFNIKECDILKFVDSIPERIQAVIDANGGHTRW